MDEDEDEDAREGEGEEVKALKRRRRQEALAPVDFVSSDETKSMELLEFQNSTRRRIEAINCSLVIDNYFARFMTAREVGYKLLDKVMK